MIGNSGRADAARTAWVVVAALVTATWGAAVASQWNDLVTICHPASACTNFQLNATTAQTLSGYGVSPLAGR